VLPGRPDAVGSRPARRRRPQGPAGAGSLALIASSAPRGRQGLPAGRLTPGRPRGSV